MTLQQRIVHRRDCAAGSSLQLGMVRRRLRFGDGAVGSIVEVARFEIRFAVSLKQLAEWFGVELAWIVADGLLGAHK